MLVWTKLLLYYSSWSILTFECKQQGQRSSQWVADAWILVFSNASRTHKKIQVETVEYITKQTVNFTTGFQFCEHPRLASTLVRVSS